MYVGNSRNSQHGMEGLVIKELRLWSYKRSYIELRDWRFQQVDPRQLAYQRGLFPLLTYIRFSEANFKEFNFASIIPDSGVEARV